LSSESFDSDKFDDWIKSDDESSEESAFETPEDLVFDFEKETIMDDI
jgi:hypothetical protein